MNTTQITDFWKHYEGSYAGDVNARQVVRLSKKYIKGRILDVGAGSGALMNLLPNSFGIDIAPHNNRITKASIDALPFENGEFDTVFMIDVFEHLPYSVLERGLGEIRRVTRGDAKLILNVPYKENLRQNTVLCPSCGSTFHRWGHLRSCDETMVWAVVAKAKFRVISASVVPLSLMAEHKMVRMFWPLLVKRGFIKASDLFVVAERC